jgi:tetratricopeptide (TPR) repeat protein
MLRSTGAAVVVAFVAVMVCPPIPVDAKDRAAKAAKEDMGFGYKVARRGYWQEALERFEQADAATPNQPRILNNIAVALEANGRFTEAREVYERARALDPSNNAVRRNLARFEEFYKAFIAVDDEGDGESERADAEHDDAN